MDYTRGEPMVGAPDTLGVAAPMDSAVTVPEPDAVPLSRDDATFGQGEVTRWLERGFIRPATTSEVNAMKRAGRIFPAFSCDQRARTGW